MKKIIKISIILLLCAIIGVTISNATSNDKLPSKTEVTAFITEMNGSSAADIFSKVKEQHPAWNADLLSCGNDEAIALYYTDSGSKGYGGLYVKDGKNVSPGDLKGYTVKELYKGKLEDLENTTEENTSTQPDNSTVIKDDETEKNSDHTYKDFTTALDSYTGKTDCTSKSCAQSLSDYFKGKGYSTEVKYCVAVTTSDEGTVYVVLGV